MGLWVEAGGLFEEEHEHGIAHLLEHLVFKGTRRRTARELARAIEGHGGNLGAFTEKEFCCYYAVVLDDHLEIAVDVLCDLILNYLFDESQLAKEKGVILEEISDLEDTPEDLVHDLLAEGLWPDHPIGTGLLGSRESVVAFTGEDIRAFWRRRYAPSTLTVAAAGSIDPTQLRGLFERWLVFEDNGAPRGAPPALPTFQRRTVIAQRSLAQVHLLMGARTAGAVSQSRFPLLVFNAALGGGMGSRLFQTIRETHGLVYSVYSQVAQMRDTGMLGVYLATDPSNLGEASALLSHELGAVCAEGITAEELGEAKEQIKGALVLSQESTSARMTRLATHQAYFGLYMDLDETIAAIDAVRGEEVIEMARSLFWQQEPTVALVGPVGEEPCSLREELTRSREAGRQV
ncbi:insulinase family protein [Candidatus Fermentibacteria bacterium]|nr:insulinase family protein [Candidatus Fermentibacteria bacterium]